MADEPEVKLDSEETTNLEPTDPTQLTAADLRKQVIELGFPEAEANKIIAKSTLGELVKVLQLSKEQPAQKVATLEPVINPGEEKQVGEQWKSKAQRQWEYWDSQPKVRILVPLTGKETQGVINWVFDKGLNREVPVHISGAIQPVTENGAQFLIPKGQYLEVPQPVADVIQKKFQQISDAGKTFLVDRLDPAMGGNVRDRL